MPTYTLDYRDKRANGQYGAIGFCVEVTAATKTEALTKLRETHALPESITQPVDPEDDNDDPKDVRVYFYPEALTEDDLELETP